MPINKIEIQYIQVAKIQRQNSHSNARQWYRTGINIGNLRVLNVYAGSVPLPGFAAKTRPLFFKATVCNSGLKNHPSIVLLHSMKADLLRIHLATRTHYCPLALDLHPFKVSTGHEPTVYVSPRNRKSKPSQFQKKNAFFILNVIFTLSSRFMSALATFKRPLTLFMPVYVGISYRQGRWCSLPARKFGRAI